MGKEQVYIFDRKELVILLVLLLLIAILSFTLGVKLGKDLQIPPQLSKEELNEKPLSSPVNPDPGPSMEAAEKIKVSKPKPQKDTSVAVKKKISGENVEPLETTDSDLKKIESALAKASASPVKKPTKASEKSNAQDAVSKISKASMTRFTLQFSSHRKRLEAQRKRDNLLQMGVQAEVLRVHLKEKGTWYRVISGKFSTKSAAIDFGRAIQAKVPGTTFILQSL